MASSSSSPQQNAEQHAFSGIAPQTRRRRLCGSSKSYDVFINHRGPDVKQTVALYLYNFLDDQGLSVFLDSEELELGDSISSKIETAIRSSSVHIAVFSRGYADSAWCLEELSLMLETPAKIIPVFYDVEPTELRYIKNDYDVAFAKYEEKRRYLDKLERWKESLRSASDIKGYEFRKHNSDHKDLCEEIGRAVVKEVQNAKPLHVADHSVGLDKLVKHFETCCGLEKMKETNVNIVGIFGMGGVGKTTLARELFNRKRSQYNGACFLSDVREASAKRESTSLQSKLLKDLFHKGNVTLQSVNNGISELKSCLGSDDSLKFLVVVDDIDNIDQLDALIVRDLVSSEGNLVIVTTRDKGVLISAGITLSYNLEGMNADDGKELFCWHAIKQRSPRHGSGYEHLVNAFVEVCGGLPLSLKVLGGLVFGREPDYWRLQLDKICKVLHKDVMQSLKVSFDSLDEEEKQIFLDIACFFIGITSPRRAINIWKKSGWTSAEHALQRLKEKCLVEEDEWQRLRMHDHLRDLGRAMAEEMRPRRIWRPEHLQSLKSKGFQKTLAETNGRCFHYMTDSSINAQITYFLGNSNDCAQTSTSLLLLELGFNHVNEHTCIPSWIPLQNLVYLNVWGGSLRRLWQNNEQAPSQLKELVVYSELSEIPDLSGLVNQLERVDINKKEIKIQGWLKSVTPGSFVLNSESTIRLRGELSCRDIRAVQPSTMYMSPYFPNLLLFNNLKLPGTWALNNGGQSSIDLEKLAKLNIIEGKNSDEDEDGYEYEDEGVETIGVDRCEELCLKGLIYLDEDEGVETIGVDRCEELCLKGLKYLETFKVDKCSRLKCLEVNDCSKLEELMLTNCEQLVEVCLEGLKYLKTIKVYKCSRLKCLEINDCRKLEELMLTNCEQLVEVCLEGLKYLKTIKVHKCLKLNRLDFNDYKNLETIKIGGCWKLNSLEFRDCKKLKNVVISFCDELAELSFEGLNCLQMIEVGACVKLVMLNIRDCPELKELLKPLAELISLEKITIDGCGKLNRLDLERCANLKTVSGNFDVIELVIDGCIELEELPNLAQMSRLERIKIEGCKKLQDIAGIEELQGLKTMELSLDSNSNQWLQRLSKVPSEYMSVIGRAGDGAHSTLNSPDLFSSIIGNHAVRKIHIGEDGTREVGVSVDDIVGESDCLSAIIVCAHVVVPRTDCDCLTLSNGFEVSYSHSVEEGEWMVSMVMSDENQIKHFIQDKPITISMRWYSPSGKIKNACVVSVKKGQEWEAVQVVKAICNQLYK